MPPCPAARPRAPRAGTAFALPPAVKFRWLSRRAREIVAEHARHEAESELERLLVAGAVVVRDGEHYRIESGDDAWSELEARARRLRGPVRLRRAALVARHARPLPQLRPRVPADLA